MFSLHPLLFSGKLLYVLVLLGGYSLVSGALPLFVGTTMDIAVWGINSICVFFCLGVVIF